MPTGQKVKKSPADKVIEAFDGVEALAKAANCSVWRVYRLRKTGVVPANLQGPILAAARRRGLRLSAEDLIDTRPAPERRRKPAARERVRA